MQAKTEDGMDVAILEKWGDDVVLYIAFGGDDQARAFALYVRTSPGCGRKVSCRRGELWIGELARSWGTKEIRLCRNVGRSARNLGILDGRYLGRS